ncbi:J protein JJJ2 [Drosophila serrata]|uniref:J protein JJJ2 n=1 Tax=Drosophila serrata TaxID=7274 RepID=UPI000A1D1E9B|nr:J protein JJJ2 [Drosophila serrata]
MLRRSIQIGHLPPVRSLAGFGSRFNYQSLRKLSPHHGENYYQVLNVPVCSSHQEIKSAFIELSKKYHPDGNSQTRDSEVFMKICEAYQTLHRQNSRQLYDSCLRMQRQTTSPSETAFTSRQISTRWSQYQSAMRSKQMSRNSQTYPRTKTIIFRPRKASQYLPMCIAMDLQKPWELMIDPANGDEYKDGRGEEGDDGYEDWFRKSWTNYFPFIFYLYAAGLCGVGGLVSMDLVRRSHNKPMSEDDIEPSSFE